jgi:hypothetical protein
MIEYRIDNEKRLVVATGHGVVTDGDVFGYQLDVWARPEVDGYNELVDMSDVQDIAVPSVDHVRNLASLSATMDSKSRSSKFAIVAPEAIAFALGQMYAALRGMNPESTKRVEVFRTMGEALAFLGIDTLP